MDVKTATDQEIFNEVCRGLKSQGWQQCVSEELDECALRDGKGRKCAIGHLITDEQYSMGLEGYSPLDRPIYELWDLNTDEDGDRINFLYELQEAHDHDAVGSDRIVKDAFRRFARNYGLEVPSE